MAFLCTIYVFAYLIYVDQIYFRPYGAIVMSPRWGCRTTSGI